MSLSIEHTLIIKLFKIRDDPSFKYWLMMGGFTEEERKLLDTLIKQDYERGFKEAGFDKCS